MIASEYIEDVIQNREKYPKTIVQLVERHLNDLLDINDDSFPYYFNEEAANHVIQFAESLKHVKGFHGQKVELLPWQVFWICCVYGWREKGTGYRRFRTVYTQVPRKVGKTFLSAIIVLYHLTHGESEDIFSIATKKEQAREVFDSASKILSQFAGSREYIRVYQHKIAHLQKPNTYTPKDAESTTSDGLNPSLVIVDEFHAHKNKNLYNVYRSAVGARPQWLIITITTAGYEKGPCYDEYQRCKKVLDGTLKDNILFPFIYELDEDDDWKDEKNWYKVNPNLGKSTPIKEYRDFFNSANQVMADEFEFKTKWLNLWSTDHEETWIDQKTWDQCKRPFDESELEGRTCYGGIDLAGVSDLTGYTLYFPFDDYIVAKHRAYIPHEKLEEKQRLENSNYFNWVQDGFITTTEGAVTDHGVLVRDLVADAQKYQIVEAGYDPYKSGNIISLLEQEGIPLVPINQGIRYMSEPCKDWERSVRNGEIVDSNPVMEWCVSNTVVKPDNHENIIPLKKDGKRHNKIDLVITSVIAKKILSDNHYGVRDVKIKESPITAWAESLVVSDEEEVEVKADDDPIKENPLNAWAANYLKENQ